MTNSTLKSGRITVTLMSLIFLSLLIFLEYYFFQRFIDQSYINFWIEQGSFIAFGYTLIGLVWTDLDKQHPDLVSIHPGFYLRSCFIIMSGLSLAFANSLPGKNSFLQLRKEGFSTIRLLYEYFFGIIFYFLLFIISFAWLLGIAPTMYFISFITGAPARLAMLNRSGQFQMVRSSTDSKGITTNNSLILSFRDKPVTMTEVITSGFFLLIKAFWSL